MLKIKQTNSIKYGSLYIGDFFLYNNDPYIVTDRVQSQKDESTSVNLTSGRTFELDNNTIVELIYPTLEY